MSFNSNKARVEYISGNSQDEFSFLFKIYEVSDINVWRTSSGQPADDVADLLTLNTDYTVVINGNNGGKIVLVNPASTGDSLVLTRSLPINRTIEYQSSGDLLAETLNNDEEYQTYLIADRTVDLARFLKVPQGSHGMDLNLPSPSSDSYIRWNTSANKLINDTTIPQAVVMAQNAATFSSTKASESLQHSLDASTNGQIRVWEAEAKVKTAHSYATEPYMVFVKAYTSNGDGTFTTVNTSEYSALHYKTDSKKEADRSASNSNNIDMITVETISDLLLIDINLHNTTVIVREESRGGTFVYDTTQAGTNNQGTIFNGWIRQYSGAINVKWFDAKGDGISDDTLAIQKAINTKDDCYIPAGLYLIDPSIGLTLTSNKVISGDGKKVSLILAKYNVAGSVIKREFNAGVHNEYVTDCVIEDIGIFLNHIYQNTVPANIQIGINLSNVTRSQVRNCYVGNYKFGKAATLFPNVSKPQMARGYGIVCGNVSGSDVAYAGGEVNELLDCTIISAEYGIGVDLVTLTGGVSAAYGTKAIRNDIQSCRVGIAQESKYGGGSTITDNTVQDALTPEGVVGDKFHIYFCGMNSTISGGYFESPSANLTNDIKLGPNSNGIRVGTIQHSHTYSLFINDEGTNNTIDSFAYNGTIMEPILYKNKTELEYVKGFINFLGDGTVIRSLNASVSKISTGDFRIDWDSSITDETSVIQVQQESSSTREIRCHCLTHNISTSRIETYSIAGSPLEQTQSDPVSVYAVLI